MTETEGKSTPFLDQLVDIAVSKFNNQELFVNEYKMQEPYLLPHSAKDAILEIAKEKSLKPVQILAELMVQSGIDMGKIDENIVGEVENYDDLFNMLSEEILNLVLRQKFPELVSENQRRFSAIPVTRVS